jgi:uncharacterized membrane protein
VVTAWRPSRRLLAVVLFLSLLLNLFLAGLILGRVLHSDLWPGQNTYTHEFGFFAGRAVQRLVRNLDAADRQTVIETMRAHREELDRLSQQMHDQRERVDSLMRAPQFDRSAAEQAFAQMRQRGDAMQTALGNAIIDAIAKLPPEGRQRLAK